MEFKLEKDKISSHIVNINCFVHYTESEAIIQYRLKGKKKWLDFPTNTVLALSAKTEVELRGKKTLKLIGVNNVSKLPLVDGEPILFISDEIVTPIVIKGGACGFYHTGIIKEDGTVHTIGRNEKGQLGLGDKKKREKFTDTGVIADEVKCAGYRTALTYEGKTLFAGQNLDGRFIPGGDENILAFTELV